MIRVTMTNTSSSAMINTIKYIELVFLKKIIISRRVTDGSTDLEQSLLSPEYLHGAGGVLGEVHEAPGV